MKTQTDSQIIKQGYQALIDALGVANTIKFLMYLNPGQSDYSKERHQLLENITIDEFLEDLEQIKAKNQDNLDQYDEVIY